MWIDGQYDDAETEDWKMKTEIHFGHNNVLDDAKEATEANKEDLVRQDLALISSSAQNLKTRSWIYGQYDDAEEEAGTKAGTSAEQEEPSADEEEVKMTPMRQRINKTERKMMRMLHKHLEDAEEKGSRDADTKSVPEVEIERAEDEAEEGADADDLREDDREHLIKGTRSKDDSEDTADEEVTKQDEAPKNRESIKKEPASATIITDATGMKTETKEGAWEDTVEVDKNETTRRT